MGNEHTAYRRDNNRVIGIIPARYQSSRFPGKPLADICGKPMIWWVCQQVKKVQAIERVYVATDDERIQNVCQQFGMDVVMTSHEHPTALSRICEFSEKVHADFYVWVNGDEPLINPDHIVRVIPTCTDRSEEKIAINTIAPMRNPAEVNDPSNIKVVFDKNQRALYMSRAPIPYPGKRIDFCYWKHVGITCLSKAMLDAYPKMPKGEFESIEGVDHLRIIDAGETMRFVKIEQGETLSVDTPMDIEKVRRIIEARSNQSIS